MNPASRQRIIRAVAALSAATALIMLYRAAVRITGIMPRCLFKLATGWSCPGCGSQRAFNAVIHGNLRDAFEVNMLLPVGLAYLCLLGAGYMLPGNKRIQAVYTRATSPKALIAVAAVIAGWTVIRNILGI